MPPVSNKIGNLFRKKDEQEHTPPKALYDDLESAHESIARNSSSSHLPTSSPVPVSSSLALRPSSPSPVQKASVRGLALRFNSTTPPAQPPKSSPIGLQKVIIRDDETRVGPQTSSQVSDMAWMQESTASGPAATDSIANDPSSSHPPQHIQSDSKNLSDDFHQALPDPQNHLPVMSRDDRSPVLVASDTVDNILTSYCQRSSAQSLQNPHPPVSSHIDAAAIRGASTTPNEGSAVISQPELESHGRADKEPTFADHAFTTSESSQPLSNAEEALIDEGDYHSSAIPTIQNYSAFTSRTMQPFAWSPCPSEHSEEDDVGGYDPDEHDLREPSRSKSNVPINSDRTTSPSGSYGNTRNLLNLSGSGASGDASSHSHAAQASLQDADPVVSKDKRHHAISRATIDNHDPMPHKTGRFSGIVSDGTSSRPMSETEMIESLSGLVKAALRAPTSSDGSSVAEQRSSVGEGRMLARQAAAALLGARAGDLAIELGLAESLTSSSTGHGYDAGASNSRKDQADMHKVTPGSNPRSGTPPALFGRKTPPSSDEPSNSRPSLLRKDSRLARAAAAAGVKEHGRLGRAMANSPERDWITETDVKTSGDNTGLVKDETTTGSSIADMSDSMELSHSSQQQSEPKGAIEIPSHSVHPRYHNSFSLHKNIKTGFVGVTQDIVSREGTRIYNDQGSSNRSFTSPGPSPFYQHPPPLPKDHPHPMSTSPRMTPSSIELRPMLQNQGHPLTTHEKRLQRELTSSDISYVSTDSGEHDTHEESQSPDGGIFHFSQGVDQGQEDSLPLRRLRRVPSSTWLSTVSEGQSPQSSPRERVSSFQKMASAGPRGNVTGTLDGTRAREVGSSLADASSPVAQFSSSPPVLLSSPPEHLLKPAGGDIHQPVSKPGSAVLAFHRHLEDHHIDETSGWMQEASRGHDFFDTVTYHGASKASSACENSPSCEAHKRRNRTTSGFGRRYFEQSQQAKPESSEEDEKIDWLKYLRPRRGARKQADYRSSPDQPAGIDSAIPATTKGLVVSPKAGADHILRDKAFGNIEKSHDSRVEVSPTRAHSSDHGATQATRPTSYNGTVYTTVPPPVLDHPMYGPRDRHRVDSQYAILHPEFDARQSSPHLYGFASEVNPRMKRFSILFGGLCIVFFIFGPLYGHGHLDGCMRWYSDGRCAAFPRKYKVIVLVCSYAAIVLVIVGLVLAMILISR
ncbi:MAG: hypothetical protein OHK93_001464 [Ramalina farinacea]|uniref:Uncharacterized protein n=1 Tax=Ramalina farinacea TaxID=258253 RepID=A0AA43QRM3_9LECA|nr:hypothetical protein [Ramalina farinacea]